MKSRGFLQLFASMSVCLASVSIVTDCKAKGLRYLRLVESMCYNQRALFFALLLSCLQPAISQIVCAAGTTGPNGGPCVNCAAGKYRVVSIASGLSNLSSIIAMSKLQEWTQAGYTLFKMGNGGQTCLEACINSKLLCHDFKITQQETAAILALIRQNYNALINYPDTTSPFCASGNCFWQGTTTTSMCHLPTNLAYTRLCACGSGLGSKIPCTNCTAGTYSTATGASVAATCTNCTAGTYSVSAAAEAESSCLSCPSNSGHALTGQTALTTCVCNTGFSGQNGGTCTACVVGKYSVANPSSTCLNCAAGKYGHLVGSGLIGVTSSIAMSTVEAWTEDGVSEWKMGDGGESCDTVCRKTPGLECRAQLTPEEDTRALFASFGKTYIGWESLSDTLAPFCVSYDELSNVYNGQEHDFYHCVYGEEMSMCDKAYEEYFRLCACGSSVIDFDRVATCHDCVAGKYLGTEGSDAATDCVPCAKGKYSTTVGASSSTACLGCDAGKYSDTEGASSCEMCSGGMYSTTLGASSATTCLDCGVGKYSTTWTGSTYCVCNAGTKGPNGGPCTACEKGKYKPPGMAKLTCGGLRCNSGCTDTYGAGAESGIISDGPDNYANSADCWWLLATSLGAEIRISFSEFQIEESHDYVSICIDTSCSSPPKILSGFLGKTGVYTSSTGFLKVTFKSDSYTTFTGFTATWTVAGLASTECDNCPSNSAHALTGQTAVTACVCNTGFTGPNGGTCTQCVAGKYKAVVGTFACTDCGAGKYMITKGASSCTDCDANTYSTTTGSNQEYTCWPCPANSQSQSGATTCVCMVGYTGPGLDKCEECPANFTSPVGSTAANDCVCDSGYAFQDVSWWVPRSTVIFPSMRDISQSCAAEDNIEGAYEVNGTHNDRPLYKRKTSDHYLWYLHNVWYVGHKVGTIKDDNNQQLVRLSLAGAFQDVSEFKGLWRDDCPIDGIVVRSSYFDNNRTSIIRAVAPKPCEACELGKFKLAAGNFSCTPCPNASTPRAGGRCECFAGFRRASDGSCLLCEAGTFSAANATVCDRCPAHASLPSGSTAVASCTCDAGYAGPDGGPCAACVENTYKNTSGSISCLECPELTVSVRDGTHCRCAPGYTGLDGGPCTACAVGTYKGAQGSAACTSCPANSVTDSTTSSSCKCTGGRSMKPVKETVQLSDDNFAEITPGRFTALDLHQGVQVSVRWETKVFEVRDSRLQTEFSTKVKFRGLTSVFVPEDFSGTLTYSCSGCTGSGSINLVPAVHECIAESEVGDEFQRVFTTRGTLDKPDSCTVQCITGFYRTHSLPGWRCEPHWEPVCGLREFLVSGTRENNAYCRPCSGCARQRLVSACTATSNDKCEDCGGPAGQIWTNAHGAACKAGCEGGFILNKRAGVCEPCAAYRCPAGYGFPPADERDNCTHCAACETLPVKSGSTQYLPKLAEWDDAEDREDCVATCKAGYSLVVGNDGRLECTLTARNIPDPIPPARSAAAARCAGAGEECLLPGCTLHEQVCTACFDLPEALQRGRFGLESQQLLPNSRLSDESDKLRFRWQFLGWCEWACLSPWAAIQSEDGLYWKCEKKETVHNILMSKYWDTKFADDSAEWVDEKRGFAALMQTSSALLVAALAFVALLACVVCSTFARECCRTRPLKKRKV
jgi:hypothetical protein